MNTDTPLEPLPQEPLAEKVKQSYVSAKESATSCCETIRKESSQMCECTSDAIKKNPIAYVAGAAFVGAVVCYLILEGRSQPTFQQRYVSRPLSNAGDSVSDSVNSLYNSLKFW